MEKRMGLVLMIFAIYFLSSCASHDVIIPSATQKQMKTYTVNEQGTVIIKGQSELLDSMHWLYVECNHWSGCYMRCKGKMKSCRKVANYFNLEVNYHFSDAGTQH
jgi:hypothetical protein